ncbi:sirohydrochlorin chelatase [Thermomonospora sp. CIF 1]|uniref:sirohydrochlorin chelatase n=1 Tax=Thermomonospora sp. CIF 1 TaxID=1916083 RepID=UPI000A445CDF|nr:sirohydrochlorin chelatase [Thermomonospora sp. CIF 1]PKK14719.1 MAG: cobalamin biosynthesis protein CbiX [Thermomonospora sp. CIF 1]
MRHSPLIRTGRPVPLVAVAHGSRDPRSALTVARLLAAVRRRRPGLPVLASYLDHAPPSPDRVLRGLQEDAAVVLPLLLTAAYHSKIDIPGVLAGVRTARPRLHMRLAGTLGPHPLLIAALERRLAEAGVPIGDPDTAVVLVAAGSSDPAANATVAGLAHGWRAAGWWNVVPAFASAARPLPADAVASLLAAGAPRVAVASYFLAPGHFADKVRAESLAAGAAVVSDVLGDAPELAEVVLHRYDECLAGAGEAAAV